MIILRTAFTQHKNKKKATSFSFGFLIFFWLVFCSFLDQVEINRFFAKKIKKIKVQDCAKLSSYFCFYLHFTCRHAPWTTHHAPCMRSGVCVLVEAFACALGIGIIPAAAAVI
jgi:hypothetical protein